MNRRAFLRAATGASVAAAVAPAAARVASKYTDANGNQLIFGRKDCVDFPAGSKVQHWKVVAIDFKSKTVTFDWVDAQ